MSMNVLHGLATSTTTLCFVYVVILDLFRITVFENESVITSVGEALLCSGLVAAAFYSNLLSNVTEVVVQTALIVFSCVFAYRMKKFYVSGMKYTTENLDGKVYIITGSNTGLGFETAKHIVFMGGTVILACRSVDKAAIARDSILHSTKCAPTKVIVIKLDLCGFDSVRKFVKEFRSLSLPLNGLINNAGVMMPERVLTQDGFETVFTANHLSHFLLTNLLLPQLEKTSGRVINVTSTLHKSLTSFNFDDVMSVKNYSLFGTYSQSKLANILFTTELQKRMRAKGSTVTCNAIHPGCVNTEVTRNMGSFMRFLDLLVSPLLLLLRKTPAEGAYTSIYAATSSELEGVGGKYFYHCKSIPPGKCALNQEDAEKLWQLSERLTGLLGEKYDVST